MWPKGRPWLTLGGAGCLEKGARREETVGVASAGSV